MAKQLHRDGIAENFVSSGKSIEMQEGRISVQDTNENNKSEELGKKKSTRNKST